MIASRHGGRVGLLVLALGLAGCGGEAASPPDPPRSTLKARRILPQIPGIAPFSAVSEIIWGEGVAAGQLAVLSSDGRFALHRFGRLSQVPPLVSASLDEPARALTIVTAGRVVTGTDKGLISWDTSGASPQVLSRFSCGAVSSVVKVPGQTGESSILVGLRDGKLLRCRLSGDGSWERIAENAASGMGVSRLVLKPGSSDVIVLRSDGSSQRMRSDLIGSAVDFGKCRGIAFGPENSCVARATDEFTVEVGPAPARRVTLPHPLTSLLLADRGRVAIVGMGDLFLIADIPPSGPISPSQLRCVKGVDGPTRISLDPSDPKGLRLAIGYASGTVEQMDLETLMSRASPAPLDDIPSVAFQPWLRFSRSRDRGAQVGEDPRIDEDRTNPKPGHAIQEVDPSDRSNPQAIADSLALAASAGWRNDGATSSTLVAIERARDSFARLDQRERVADCDFWLGLLQSPAFVPGPSGRSSRASGDAVVTLRRAESMYRFAEPPRIRQAWLASAAIVWNLLDRGETESAAVLLALVQDAASRDPVLRRVVELDRIAGALAMAQGDHVRAEQAYGRLLSELSPGEQPGLKRLACLGRAQALAALGRWCDAATVLEEVHPKDAEWTLRRLVCRLAAGLDSSAQTLSTEDEVIEAHTRALWAIATSQTLTTDLERLLPIAIEGHRQSGQMDLALEAELALAEFLSRTGRSADAASHFKRVVHDVMALPDRDDARRGERAILGLQQRAARGWLREEVAGLKLGDSLLAVHENPFAKLGALGLNAEEFPDAERLFSQRQKFRKLGGSVPHSKMDEIEIEIRRLETLLAGRRSTRANGSAVDLEAGNLGLRRDEAILSFVEIGSSGQAGILVREGASPFIAMLPVGRAELAALVMEWRSGLGDGGRPIKSRESDPSVAISGLGPEPEARTPSASSVSGSREARLHDALLGQFQAHFDGLTRLFLVPVASLSGLPIEVMGREQRLLDRFLVTYLPDPAMLSNLRDARRATPVKSHGVLFLSSDDEREVRFWAMACRDARWKPVALLGPAASRDRLFSLDLGSYSAVHLAAPIQPVGSHGGFSMKFSDGLFTARTASLPLRSRVLVLQFAGSDGLTGEGIRQWAHAGLLTGAGSVVISLWEPPVESARVFFAEFYRSLESGGTTSDSVAKAREAVGNRTQVPRSRALVGFRCVRTLIRKH